MLDHKLSNNCLLQYQNSRFHYQVLQSWFEVKARPPNNASEILNEYVCLNRYIKIGGLSISPDFFGKKDDFIDLKVGNLLNDNNQIGSAEEIQGLIHCKRSILSIN